MAMLVVVLCLASLSADLAWSAADDSKPGLRLLDRQNAKNRLKKSKAVEPAKAKAKSDGEAGDSSNKADEDEFVWVPPQMKEFSKAQIRAECQKYDKQYIGYYGRLFWVESCRLRELLDSDLINRLFQHSDVKVKSVGGETVAMMAKGEPLKVLPTEHLDLKSCKQLQGHYVIYGGSDVYYVDRCKKHLISDYETYVDHARRGKRDQVIVDLLPEEFYGIPDGPVVPSIMTAVAKRLMDRAKEVDIIPVSEACSGIDGQFVSYYSHIYFIENCRKRQVFDLAGFLAKKQVQEKHKLVELESDQWISLPDGAPLDELPQDRGVTEPKDDL